VFNVRLSEVILMLPSDNMESTLAIKCELLVDYKKECIANVKSELLKDVKTIQYESEALETSSLFFKLNEMCLFMCDARAINERGSKSIKKRKIFEISSMKLMMRTLMEFNKLTKVFSTSNTITLYGKEVFIIISYKDVVSLTNSLTHNIIMLDREYSSHIGEHDEGIFTRLDSNGALNRFPRQGEYIPRHRDDNIENVVKRMSEAVNYIKKTLKDLAQYKLKTIVSPTKLPNLNKNLAQLKKHKTNAQLFELTNGHLFDKHATTQKKEKLATSGSFHKSSILPSNKDSRLMLGEYNTSTKITFQNIKIVFL